MEVRETKLPGVGLRYEFENRDGERIAVIALRGGDFECSSAPFPVTPTAPGGVSG